MTLLTRVARVLVLIGAVSGCGSSDSSGNPGENQAGGPGGSGQAGSAPTTGGQAGASGQGNGGTSAGSGGSAGVSGAGVSGSSGQAGQGASGQPGAGAGGGADGQAGSSGVAGSGGGGAAGQGGAAGAQTSEFWTGVNLSCGEFGEGKLPGNYSTDYTYPTSAEVDYFVGKQLGLLRVPFRWERLQHQALGELDATEMTRLDAVVTYATEHGGRVLLDPHNYARYYGKVLGTADAPDAQFADFWQKLAAHYKDNDRVIFGLMNEPHDLPTEQWLGSANAAIAAIRKAGAKNLITVPGNAYTGAHSWLDSWYGKPNGEVMLGVVDPGNNFAFEVHQYLDTDSSGTKDACVSATIGSERLKAFTGWLKQHGHRGLLGELGAGRNDTCYAALDDALTHIDQNRDVWMGWTYWAAGPWWGDYMFSLEPENGQDRPQMAPLLKHVK